MSSWAALAAGGVLGTFGRVLCSRLLPAGALPWGTLAVNLSGCLLIGLFDALIGRRASLGPETRALLVAGFCGAFTTFSTLVLEAARMLDEGAALRCALYLAASVALGLLLFRLGGRLGHAL